VNRWLLETRASRLKMHSESLCSRFAGTKCGWVLKSPQIFQSIAAKYGDKFAQMSFARPGWQAARHLLRELTLLTMDRNLKRRIRGRARTGDMMSIAMDHFRSNERETSNSSASLRILESPYHLQCHTCGFERFDAISPPLRCPKCTGDSWERFTIAGSLLKNTDPRVRKRSTLRSLRSKANTI